MSDDGSGCGDCCFTMGAGDSEPNVCCFTKGSGASEPDMGNNNSQIQAFPRRARMDIAFEDIKFTVKEWTLKHPIPVEKDILKGVSGVFPSGELTAIMGPSGAGKSTLLNAMATYVEKGVTGKVLVNQKPRDVESFRRQSCYIQQDEYLYQQLTVLETMCYSSDLKLGSSVSKKQKLEQIYEILSLLGLSHCTRTPTKRLSGGQRKRLSVAQELVSNPPIIFLDEPTTGLDSSSCSQCIQLLKFLAKQGRTVVCTIHQPSSLVFNLFDNLYMLVAGECLYSGKTQDVVSYFSSYAITCPVLNNPADYIMDVAMGDYKADIPMLKKAAKEQVAKQLALTRSEKMLGGVNNNQMQSEDEPVATSVTQAPYLEQALILTRRKALIAIRSPKLIITRLLCHVFVACLFGYLYGGVGQSAKTTLGTYIYLYGSTLFLAYTGKMSAVLMFPQELMVVLCEHFNRWYNLGPYYFSVMAIELPIQVISCFLYLPLSYYLTGQPLEWIRLGQFCLSCVLLSLVCQAFGFLIGILFPRKIAVFIGPILICLMSVFGFCLRYSDIPIYWRWCYYISYYRAAFHNILFAVFGLNRGNQPCPPEEVICIFQDPDIFLRELEIQHVDLNMNYLFITACFCIFQIATVATVWHRLNKK